MHASDATAEAPGRPALLRSARRYLLVGAGSAVTDLSIYAALIRIAGWDPLLANLVSRPCGGLFSFVMNKTWTFGRREMRGTGRQGLRFLCVWIGAYALSEGLVALFTRGGGFSPMVAKVAAEAVAGTCIFLSHRLWTFRVS